MSDIKIDRKLNLVVPIENDGEILYVHSAPISHAVFERYFKVIARTFSELYGGGYGIMSGPRIAAMLLKSVSSEMGVWDGVTGVENGLMSEIRRITNVICLDQNGGWVTIPFHDAAVLHKISDDDIAEVENAIVFFTLASAMHKKADLPEILGGASKLWGGLATPSSIMEFITGLPTPTQAVSIGETARALSIPS